MVIRNKGFTLLEVAVTVAILATALVVIISQVAKGIKLSTDAKFSSLSAILAQAKMSEIELSGGQSASSMNGDFGKDHPGFSWVTRVADSGEDIRQVTVTIRWGEGSEQKEFALTNYLYKGSK